MTRTHRLRRFLAILMSIAVVLTVTAPAVLAKKPDKPPKPVDIQILGLNDFHGQLEVVPPLSSSGGRIGSLQGGPPPAPQFCVPGGTPDCIPAGGVENLATHVRALRAENPVNTVFVSAGDLIGATPLLSALFHDEPTIEAMNLLGLDYNGVGNHEFDEGITELLRMQYGNEPGFRYSPARPDGCHPTDGCGDLDPYFGADFPFLAANVVYRDTGETIFPPYAIHDFDRGAKVAFVGMTLEGTDLIVSPGGIASVDFQDEAASVNALVPHLKRRGVEAIVVLLHEGGSVPFSGNGAGAVSAINSCTNPTGPLPSIVQAMDAEIDVVITGHTNWAINCPNLFGKVVTGAASQARLITEIDAQIDKNTNDFVPGSFVINNEIVRQDSADAADMTALIGEYNVFAAPIANVVVGNAAVPLTRSTTPAGESILGRLIADAQLASSAGPAGAQFAFMNPGGIRADVNQGPITHGEAFGVQPFSNIVTTKTMTGAQIEQVLEQQFRTSAGGSRTLVLAVSAGFQYTWDPARPFGDKVDPATIMLNGVAVNPAGTYRVTMNSFLATGGDDFPAFNLGTNELTGADDLVALEAYLGSHSPYTPVTDIRITRVQPPTP